MATRNSFSFSPVRAHCELLGGKAERKAREGEERCACALDRKRAQSGIPGWETVGMCAWGSCIEADGYGRLFSRLVGEREREREREREV